MSFKKAKNSYIFPDEWSISEGELDKRPIFVRYRNGLENIIRSQKYVFQIGVAIPLLNPTKDGLTTDQESKILWKIEDELSKQFEASQVSIHVMTITYNGMREFVFYSIDKNPYYYEKKVQELQTNFNKGHILQFMMQPDIEWSTYWEYAKK